MHNIFVSYSRKDSPWVNRLYKHLRPLASIGLFELWSDTDIAPGENWRTAIQHAIKSASVIIIIISPDYFESNTIANEELPQLLKVAIKRSLPIIPIIVKHVDLGNKLENIRTVTVSAKALDQLSHADQEAVMKRATKKIIELLSLESHKPTKKEDSSDPHSRAFNIASSKIGVVGDNMVVHGNIFFGAERKLHKDKKHDGEE